VRLGRPAETVRGWLRRFAERTETVRSVFTVWLRAVEADPAMPGPAGGGFADAVSAGWPGPRVQHEPTLPPMSITP
jgi:hypothetical protein